MFVVLLFGVNVDMYSVGITIQDSHRPKLKPFASARVGCTLLRPCMGSQHSSHPSQTKASSDSALSSELNLRILDLLLSMAYVGEVGDELGETVSQLAELLLGAGMGSAAAFFGEVVVVEGVPKLWVLRGVRRAVGRRTRAEDGRCEAFLVFFLAWFVDLVGGLRGWVGLILRCRLVFVVGI